MEGGRGGRGERGKRRVVSRERNETGGYAINGIARVPATVVAEFHGSPPVAHCSHDYELSRISTSSSLVARNATFTLTSGLRRERCTFRCTVLRCICTTSLGVSSFLRDLGTAAVDVRPTSLIQLPRLTSVHLAGCPFHCRPSATPRDVDDVSSTMGFDVSSPRPVFRPQARPNHSK